MSENLSTKGKDCEKKKSESRQVFDNNIYMLMLLFRASKLRLPLESLFHISKGIIQTLIYTVLFGAIINSIQLGNDYKEVIRYIGGVAAVTGIGILFQTWFQETFIPMDNARIQKYMLTNVYRHASQLDIEQYENPEFYDKYVRSLEEANQRAIQLSSIIASTLGLLATIIYLLYVIVSIDAVTLIFVVIPLVPGWLLGKKKNNVGYELYLKNTNPIRWTRYFNRIMYMKEYSKEIRLFNIYPTMKKKFDRQMDEIIDNEKKYDRKSTWLTLFMDFMNDKVIYVGILVYITYQIVVKKKLLVGDYVIVQNAVASMTWRISTCISSGLSLQQSGKFIGLLREFLETKQKRKERDSVLSPKEAKELIQFKNVSFSYDRKKEVLKNINVTIRKGTKILIVGHNGAGKSTFIKLLMNLYEPTAGEIWYGDRNIREYNLEEYRELYSAVFQDFCLYALNVGENVAMNDFDEKNIGQIQDAIKRAGLQERIRKLEHGIYNEVTKELNENGFVPSGGEGQKLAIARAIYHNSNIIILDEPSSALDPVSEAMINKLMLEASAGKTVILISHRLSSAKSADEILFFSDGRIAEQGTHEELMKADREYARMFQLQAEKYDLEV